MITFDEIKKANETISTIGIERKTKEGTIVKEYAEVNQRVKAFRMVYPTGIIATDMVSNENGVCVFEATVGFYDDGEFYVLSKGTAYEKENSTFINKTSYIENCETSAVGRALGFAGFGIDTSIASAEEVKNAILNQEDAQEKPQERKASQKQIEILKNTYKEENLKKLLESNNIDKIEDLSIRKASELISKLKGAKQGD